METAESLLAEILLRTEEEGLLDKYPQRFQDWWKQFKSVDSGIILES